MFLAPGELPSLLVVDDEQIDFREHVRERLRLPVDPEVHRVGHDERVLSRSTCASTSSWSFGWMLPSNTTALFR